MLRSVRRSLARKLLVAVGLPSVLFSLLLVLWLRHRTAAAAPELGPVYGGAMLALLGFAAVMGATFVLAMRYVIEQPLQRLAAGLRRARDGDFLHRLPVESQDELGVVAETFNAALAAITDLHARRIDDARELELKAELEARRSQYRENQAQLVQADKMAALGVLVSGVAHEINNPNGYILLNMPILKAAFLDALEILDEHRAAAGGDFALARYGRTSFTLAAADYPTVIVESNESKKANGSPITVIP